MFKKPIILLIFLLASLLSACASNQPDNINNKENTATNNTNTTKPENSAETIFQNENLNFSFYFPKTCTINETKEMTSFDTGKKYEVDVVCDEANIFSIGFFSADYTAGIEEGCCSDYSGEPIDINLSIDDLSSRLTRLNPTEIEKIKIAGKEAIKFFSTKKYVSSWIDEVYILPFFGEEYSNIVITGPALETIKEDEDVDLDNLNLGSNNYKEFQKIIESLNFYEQNSDNNGGWQVYQSKRYGFELDYPTKWFVMEEDDDFTKEKFITFSNLEKRCGKGNCPYDYNAVFVRIYSNDSDAYNEYVEQKAKYEKIASTKEKIVVNGNYVYFYLVAEMSEKPDETWDMVKPVARAFFQNGQYSYMFYVASEIPQGVEGQQKEVDIVQKMLKTIRIDY